MTDITEIRIDYNKAKSEEQRARSEKSRCEQQADNQQLHLETLLTHRDECVHGLRTAKESGLNIVQIREYQLLLKHLDTVVHEQQEKVDISQVNFEKAQDVWMLKSERLTKLRELMQVAEQEARDRKEAEMNAGAGELSHGNGHDGLKGKRLNTR